MSRANPQILYIKVINERSDAIRIYWMDYDGEPQLKKTLEPGEYYHFVSYINFPYIITDLTDERLQYFADFRSDMDLTFKDLVRSYYCVHVFNVHVQLAT